MNCKDDGGPAFPVPGLSNLPNEGFLHPMSGMTLRDYFAAEAMKGMLSGHFSHYGHEDYWPHDQVASEAYEMADAMIKERENEQTVSPT